MIICHSRRFVLIRPRKVASSSVQWALLPHLTKGDLVMRVDDDGLGAPPTTGATIGNVRRGLRVLHGHSSLSRLVAVVGREVLSYRIVTLARNPWDRAVSEFYFTFRDSDMKLRPVEAQRRAFTDYIREESHLSLRRRLLDRLEGRHRLSKLEQSELCVVDGRFRADQVIFFEALEAGIAELGRALQIDLQLPDIRTKGAVRADASRDWHSFYTEETRDLVARACASDIARFGYDYEGARMPTWNHNRP